MEQKRIRARVQGRVQRVAFREYTRRQAQGLGLMGWVRNCADGTVEVLAEGTMDKVDQLLSWLAIGSPLARVTKVEYIEEEPQNETGPFEIRFTTDRR
jgi:acylphosphatase